MDYAIILLNFGYLITFGALAIRDVLWLRIILISSQICLFMYNYFFALNYYASSWMIFFILINSYMVIKIFNERRIRIIPNEIRDLYEDIFKNLTTREFLYFWNMGNIKSVKNDYLIHSGENQNNLLLVLSGEATVKVNERPIAKLGRGAFIAEISFLSGEPTSADVYTDNELIFISWRSERVKNMQHENSAFWMKLQHALSEDLIKKVKPQAKREAQIEK